MVRGLLGVASDAPPLAVRDALERWVRTSCPDRYEDVYPYMARMMSLSLDEETEADAERIQGFPLAPVQCALHQLLGRGDGLIL